MVMVDVETAARYYEYLEMEKADSSPAAASSKTSSISRKNDEGHCNCQTSSGLYYQKRPVDDHNTNALRSATTETVLIEDARRPIDDENYWPSSSSTTSQTYM